MIDVTYPDKQDISERSVSIQNKHHKCNITHTPRDNLLPGVTNNEKIIAALFLNIVYSKKNNNCYFNKSKNTQLECTTHLQQSCEFGVSVWDVRALSVHKGGDNIAQSRER